MPYRYVMLRGAKVLARCDEGGQLVADAGRVEIRYRPSDTKAYRAGLRNLQVLQDLKVLPDDTCPPVVDSPNGPRGPKKKKHAAPAPHVDVPDGSLIAYTDGACSGNPGPAGVGVVMLDGERRREYSGYLGEGTNNIAELTAIRVAAESVDAPTRPLRIYTDSSYAIGVLTKGWKAKANVALISQIKGVLAGLGDVGFVHVRGHAGIPDNERADELAVAAVSARATAGWSDRTSER